MSSSVQIKENRNQHAIVGLALLGVVMAGAVLLGLALLFVVFSPETSVAQSLEGKFAEYLDGAHRVRDFSGSVLVMKDNRILFSDGFGMADVSSAKLNTPQTIFLIASMTKQFTAAGVLLLAEKKLLKLDDPIEKYLPEYPTPAAGKVTIRHLLTHTSGIPDYTELVPSVDEYSEATTRESVVSLFKDLPLQFEPGSKWHYSNSGYYLLGLIIERVSDQTYGEYLQENIFRPLRMNNSFFPPEFVNVPGMARGYAVDSTGAPVPEAVVHAIWPFSAGGIFSTVGDVVKWDQGLRNNLLLSDESLDHMFTPVPTPHQFSYGFGWEIDSLYGHPVASHGGFGAGYQSNFLRFVDDPFCVVLLCNNDTGNLRQMAIDLAAIAHDQPYDVPVLKTPVAIDPQVYDDFVGAYEIEPETYRLIIREGDSLFSQRTGGARGLLHPEQENKFFYNHDHAATLTFERDTLGKVVAHVIHHSGHDKRAKRLEDDQAEALLCAQVEVQVDPAIYQQYAGEYEVAPGFVITFRCEDDRFFAQPTGQPEAEVFPRSETEFFFKLVDATVVFTKDDAGVVTGMVLKQGGHVLPGKKIK